MLRPTDEDARRIEKLTRINQALIQRMERMDEMRGSSYALTRTAAMLEREIMERNADLERALRELSAINAELAAARETADEANRAKSRFLRAASHDLLQPLSAAKLFLAHLAEIAGDPVQNDLVARITASFDSAEELIRALLDIARLDFAGVRGQPGAGGDRAAVPAAGDRPAAAGGAARDRPAVRHVVGDGAERPGAAAADRAEPDHQRAEVYRRAEGAGRAAARGRRRLAGRAGRRAGHRAGGPGADLQRVRAAVAVGPAGERAGALDRAAGVPAARPCGRADERAGDGVVLPGAAAADAQRLPAARRPQRRRRRPTAFR